MLEASMTEETAFPEALPRPDGEQGARQHVPGWMRRTASAVQVSLQAAGLLFVVGLAALFALPAVRDAAGQVAAEVAVPLAAPFSEPRSPEPLAVEAVPGLKIGEPVSLATGDEYVAQYLGRRYHIADGAVRVLVAAARASGMRNQVDPLLVLAVMAVESSLNPYAQSAVGATGLMQVMPDVHAADFHSGHSRRDALDPIQNVREGTRILADYIRRGGSVQRGLQLYVGAGNLPDDGGYANRVLGELSRLKLAAQGRVASALAAAQRTDQGT